MPRAATAPLPFLLLVLACWIGPAGCGGDASPPPARRAAGFSWSALADPPVAYRPWVRWWWPGGNVEEAELARELELLAEDGFGGAEIQAFDAALDPGAPADELARRLSFDTPAFYGKLGFVMEEAAALGLPLDLNLGSGWPTGGEHILPEASLQTLLWSEHPVEGPGTHTVDLAAPDMPVFYLVALLSEELLGDRLARWEGDRAVLVAVLAARVTGGARDPNPLDLNDQVELDPSSVQVLTGLVDGDGRLEWEAPEGQWRILGFYRAPDGEYPMLNAQPEPGYVLDHFDSERVTGQLERMLGARTGLERYHGSPLRGFFNDSLELKAERFFSTDFLQAFQARRGYDLTPWLPAVLVPGADNSFLETASLKARSAFRFSEEDHRLRYDFARTVSDLFVERFVENAAAWGAERGMQLRAQNYGLNIDTILAAGAAPIPEAEQLYAGGSEMFLRMVASGAWLHGRPLVSAESMVWVGRIHMTTPLKVKAAADKLFTSGINHVVFHGFPYRKNHDYGEPGWQPFASPFGGNLGASSNFSETSPHWSHMPRVNRYLARCQYALRQGTPRADVLVYYPWLGFPTTLAAAADLDEPLLAGRLGELEPETELDDLLQIGILIGLSEPDPRVVWMVKLWPLLQGLERAGYSWAWVNDESLAAASVSADGFAVRDLPFRAVLVADSPWMRPGAAGRLAELAGQGAAVVLAGETPTAQPGFLDREAGDAAVVEAMARIRASSRGRQVSDADGVVPALAALAVPPTVRFGSGGDALRFLARDLGGSRRVVFFRNPTAEAVEAELEIEGGCPDPQWLDVWEETVRPLAATATTGTRAVRVPAHGSGLLACGLPGARVAGGAAFPPPAGEGTPSASVPLTGWTLEVTGEDVPGGAVSLPQDPPVDWRELPALRHSSSRGTYRTEVDLPALQPGEGAWLRVGWVYGAAEVRVNGLPAGALLAPPFRTEVTAQLAAGQNLIEIEVVPTLLNRLIGKASAGDPSYIQFAGKEDMLLPNGIQGPVSLDIHGP